MKYLHPVLEHMNIFFMLASILIGYENGSNFDVLKFEILASRMKDSDPDHPIFPSKNDERTGNPFVECNCFQQIKIVLICLKA